jgi:pimeloyl-ACP methyl ester carboxylesterase
MTTSYLDRGPGRIAYDVAGEGPLVVCLPSMGDLRSIFRHTVPALVDAGYRVATMDLRGHGDSDDGFDSYDDIALASDVIALIEHLGGGPAVVVGNSMGAGAGVWVAAEQPSLIAGLALVGPFVRNPKAGALARLGMRLALTKPWGPAVWTTYYKQYYPVQPPADLDEHRARIKASLARGDHWRSFVKTSRTDHTPAEERLDRVKVPVLVIMGEKDPDWPSAPDEARFVASALGGELVLLPDTGHYPQAQRPERVNPALVAFLDKTFQRA